MLHCIVQYHTTLCCAVLRCNAPYVPMEALKEGVSTSLGTGMMISTLLAMERDLNCDLVFIMYSMRLLLCGSTTASTHIKGFTDRRKCTLEVEY